MACSDVDMDIHGADKEPRRPNRRELPRLEYYEALEVLPDSKKPLHDLLQKQPAVLGSLQMMSGLFSFGVGIIFAITQDMNHSLFNLFRVSQLTGILFIIAGTISNLLFKYPTLLTVSLVANLGCIFVAVIAACLISVDLIYWSPENNDYLKMELLELFVLALEGTLSGILCFWFSKEKRSKSP